MGRHHIGRSYYWKWFLMPWEPVNGLGNYPCRPVRMNVRSSRAELVEPWHGKATGGTA